MQSVELYFQNCWCELNLDEAYSLLSSSSQQITDLPFRLPTQHSNEFVKAGDYCEFNRQQLLPILGIRLCWCLGKLAVVLQDSCLIKFEGELLKVNLTDMRPCSYPFKNQGIVFKRTDLSKLVTKDVFLNAFAFNMRETLRNINKLANIEYFAIKDDFLYSIGQPEDVNVFEQLVKTKIETIINTNDAFKRIEELNLQRKLLESIGKFKFSRVVKVSNRFKLGILVDC